MSHVHLGLRFSLGAGAAMLLSILAPAGVAQGLATAPRPVLDLSRIASPYAPREPRAAGVARTSFDRSFNDRRGGLSAGFLCGRQPAAVTSGGAAAYGVDPQGRFLGAQLRFGFR